MQPSASGSTPSAAASSNGSQLGKGLRVTFSWLVKPKTLTGASTACLLGLLMPAAVCHICGLCEEMCRASCYVVGGATCSSSPASRPSMLLQLQLMLCRAAGVSSFFDSQGDPAVSCAALLEGCGGLTQLALQAS